MSLTLLFGIILASGSQADSISFSYRGDLLLCRTQSAFAVVDGRLHKLVRNYPNDPAMRIRAARLSGGGETLFLSTDDSMIVYESRTGRCKCTIKDLWETNFAVSPDGKKVFACPSWSGSSSNFGTLRVVDAETGNMVKEAALRLADVDISPDGKYLAGACLDGTVRFWDPDTLAETAKLKTSASTLDTIAFSNDGNFLVAGGASHVTKVSAESMVEVWSFPDKKLVRTFGPASDRTTIGVTIIAPGIVRVTMMNFGWMGDGIDPAISISNMPVDKFDHRDLGNWIWSPDHKTAAELSPGEDAVVLVDTATGESHSVSLKG